MRLTQRTDEELIHEQEIEQLMLEDMLHNKYQITKEEFNYNF